MPSTVVDSSPAAQDRAPSRDLDDRHAPAPVTAGGRARRVLVIGNVCVGKTSLFDRLCGNGDHAVNVPGSTQRATRGVLALGSAAAPRSLRRRCAACAARAQHRGVAQYGCSTGGGGCPALSQAGSPRPEPRGSTAGGLAPDGPGPVAAADGTVAVHLFDTPGSMTLAANSEDEMVARDLLLSGEIDAVLLVADAKNLRRSLALALELSEIGVPMVLDLNMLDEAESMGLEIDDAELERLLGVPVNRTIAVENIGVRRLAEMLLAPRRSLRRARFPEAVEAALGRLTPLLANPTVAPRALALMLLAGDEAARVWVRERFGQETLERALREVEAVRDGFVTPLKVMLSDAVYAEAEGIAERVLTASVRSPGPLARFGGLAQQPLAGSLIALFVLVVAYLWVGKLAAGVVVDALHQRLFQGMVIPWLRQVVAPIPWEIVRDAIMDPDFGLVPTGLFLAVGIVLPVLFAFYLLQALLEDSGYIPRLAVLFDRVLRKLGLNGQGLIPLVLGFSCITMALITTRMLPTRRERLILTFLLVGLPCAPQLAAMAVILGDMPWTAAVALGAVLLGRLVLGGLLASRLLPGRSSDLILEIPRMRVPRPHVLLHKTWRRTWQFMREAVPVFLAASLIVFVFDRVGGLQALTELARPVVQDLLGLPREALHVFVMTAIRRESGVAELNLVRGAFDNVQLVVTLVVMTFAMPCINAMIVILKERGARAAAGIVVAVVLSALLTGAALAWGLRALNVTFT